MLAKQPLLPWPTERMQDEAEAITQRAERLFHALRSSATFMRDHHRSLSS
jgi:hypothetical protein